MDHRWIPRQPAALTDLPVPVRYGVLGALCAGVLGCLAGLIVGLAVYPPTAWAAIFELGVPAAVVGAILGSAVGAFALTRSSRRGK